MKLFLTFLKTHDRMSKNQMVEARSVISSTGKRLVKAAGVKGKFRRNEGFFTGAFVGLL